MSMNCLGLKGLRTSGNPETEAYLSTCNRRHHLSKVLQENSTLNIIWQLRCVSCSILQEYESDFPLTAQLNKVGSL